MKVFVPQILTSLLVCMTVIHTAQAQDDLGVVDQPGVSSVPGPMADPPLISDAPGQAVVGNYFGYTEVHRVFEPQIRVDSRTSALYGYRDGYTRISAFMPKFLDNDSLFFVDAGGFASYNPSGGANVGFGWRGYLEDFDRIIGLSGWFDVDNANQRTYQQFGLSFESLGRYFDLRANGYLPLGKISNDLRSVVTGPVFFYTNNILLNRLTWREAVYTGFDVEAGGPTPILGRYGLSAYAGFYFFNSANVGDFTGFSGRIQGQINDSWTIGAQLTHDHVFDTNAQIQVTLTIPDGKPTRWLRQLSVRDRMTQPVFRNYRTVVHEDFIVKAEQAINPLDNQPFFVVHVDPNQAAGSGNGTFENPYAELAQFDILPLPPKSNVDIIYVHPNIDGSSTNLDDGVTLLSNQRLLSTAVPHEFTAVQGTFDLPGFVPTDLPPLLENLTGGDVVTFATGAENIEVSGFTINGSATGNGIFGFGNRGVNINRNTFQNGANGVLLGNLSGTVADERGTFIDQNVFLNNLGDGLFVDNIDTAPLEIFITRNSANGNEGNAFALSATGTSAIGGIISGNTTEITDLTTQSPNLNNGLALLANGGVIDFFNLTNGWQIGGLDTGTDDDIFNDANNFSDNGNFGVLVDSTGDALVGARFINNDISRNLFNGIGILADSGLSFIEIGGPDPAQGNRIESNGLHGILLDLTGDTVMNLNIQNNLISGGGSLTPTIGTNFLGSTIDDSGFIPPDTMGGVGPNHIVEMLNGVFAIYDKTGNQISSTSLNAFFDSVVGITRGGTVFDPRIIFDPTTNRWFAAVIDGGAGNSIYLAVSDTSDPTGTWHGTQFVGDTIDGSRFNDFVTMGIDADGLVMGTNNFGSGFDVSIFSIPKADLIDGNPDVARLTRFEALNSGTFGNSIQPAVDFGASDGVTQLLADLGGGTNLARTDLTGTGGAGATIGLNTNVAVPNYAAAPDGRQPSGVTVENVSPRINGNVVEVGDSLWAVHAVTGSSGNSAIRWYEIDANTNAVLQTGLIEDANRDFYDASIAVNPAGTVLIGYSGSGPGQFISSMASVGATTGGATSFNAPLVLQAGAGNYNVDFGSGRNRWGDYSATVVDPTNPNRFWTFQERVAATDVWGVQITAVDLNAPIGSAGDGINISVTDTAVLNPATILDNTIRGAAQHGIHVTTTGGITVPDLQIRRNEITGSGGSGVFLDRFDSTTLLVTMDSNSITGNGGDGLTANSQGVALGGITIDSFDNNYDSNSGNGVNLLAVETVDILFTGNRDTMSENGLNGVNALTADSSVINLILNNSTASNNGQNGVNAVTLDNSLINIELHNFTANDNGQNGFNGESSGQSLLQVLIDSPVDPLFPGIGSTFDGNLNGIAANITQTSMLTLDVLDTSLQGNSQDGVNLQRSETSLILANFENAIMSGNGDDGLQFRTDDSDPTDPAQPLSGEPNRLFLLTSELDNNGGNGLEVATFVDSVLVVNAQLTTFNDNGADGIQIFSGDASSFGYALTGERSVFDGVTVTGNGDNGIRLFAMGNNSNKSTIFMEVNAASGDTDISGSGADGIHATAPYGTIDLLVQGDTMALGFATRIQNNADNGIEFNVATISRDGGDNAILQNYFPNVFDITSFDTFNGVGVLALDGVIVGDGDPNDGIADGNTGDGIALFNSNSNDFADAVVAALNLTTAPFFIIDRAGSLDVTINNSIIAGNGRDGINLLSQGNDNTFDAGNRNNLTVTNSNIDRNASDGVNILLNGKNGEYSLFYDSFTNTGSYARTSYNEFVFDNNTFDSNGNYGLYYEANPGRIARGSLNLTQNFVSDDWWLVEFNDLGVNPGAGVVFDPDAIGATGVPNFNAGYNADVFLSDYLNIATDINASMVFTNNQVRFNGTASTTTGDGMFLRLGTNSYLSADIGGETGSGNGNNYSGNAGADVRFGSFVAYERDDVDRVPLQPPVSIPGNLTPTSQGDRIFLDDTAQLDLRFNNNVGRKLDANVIFVIGPVGSAGLRTAAYDNVDPNKGSPGGQVRPTQLFEVDDGFNLNANNPSWVQDIQFELDSDSNFHLRTIADPLFPNPDFPQSYDESPGDPFLP